MRFLTHGNKENKSILLIHGLANTSDLFDPLLPYLKDYYVIVCELDGHSEKEQGTFLSVKDAAEKIERYVKDNHDGRLYALLGYSLGGTIATELISRGIIEAERTVLDAAFVVRMGFMTYPFKFLFQVGIWLIVHNVKIPDAVVESVMGKGNSGIVDTLLKGVSYKSIGNAALSCYKYDIKEGLRNYKNHVVYWRGENEPYPAKSARLLRKYLPQMKVRVFRGMGHGQTLHEHTEIYAKRLLSFLEGEEVIRR